MARPARGGDPAALIAIKNAYRLERQSAIRATRNARLAHGDTYNAACPICVHTHRELLEAKFKSWWPLEDLAALADLPVDEIRLHMEAVGLGADRLKNRRAMFAQMLEMGFEKLSPEDISPELMVVIAGELNRMDGDIVHKIEQKQERTVIFQQIPGPTGALDMPKDTPALAAAKQQQVIPGVLPQLVDAVDTPTVTETIPSSKVTVIFTDDERPND